MPECTIAAMNDIRGTEFYLKGAEECLDESLAFSRNENGRQRVYVYRPTLSCALKRKGGVMLVAPKKRRVFVGRQGKSKYGNGG